MEIEQKNVAETEVVIRKKGAGGKRWGVKRFSENPFLEETATGLQTRQKKLYSKGGDKMMVVNESTGEAVPAGFWTSKVVETEEFVKLFVKGVKAFEDLTGAGTKVFTYLYMEVQKRPGKDELWLNFAEVQTSGVKISEATYHKGMRELLEKGFIAQSNVPSKYFLNPTYMWNGERISIVQTFIKKDKLKHTKPEGPTLFENLDQPKQIEMQPQP